MGRLRAMVIAAGVFMVLPASAVAHSKTVYAGGPVKWQKTLGIAGVNNFLINRVTVNAGDSVVWNGPSLASGFHSIDIPRAGGSDLPLLVPGATVTGVLDAAGNPFWFNNKVKAVGFNPRLFGPSGGNVYNGSARIDSGLPLAGPKDFKVTFTKPGVYHYFCDVHYGMEGTVVVLAKGKKIPSAKADAKELKAEERHFKKEAKKVAHDKVPAHTVSLGLSGPGGLELFAMFPAKMTVAKGTTVRFMMSKDTREVHTASFGPTAYIKGLENSFSGPAPSPIGVYPSDVPKIVLTPTSHGNGFANTGALDRDKATPLPTSNTITFTKAGVYKFVCLIHTFMHGTIVVK